MKDSRKLKFMDFCAGIGGGRLGLERIGLQCVSYSEIDKKASRTYELLYDSSEKNYGDLMKIDSKTLPDFDLMIAGFPCQTFSVIGQRKGMDDHRGQVIYGLSKILREKNIKYFILENVKGLVNHDRGNSIKEILRELTDSGYEVKWRVLNSLGLGVPQMRERVYFVGVRKDLVKSFFNYEFPVSVKRPPLNDYFIDDTELEMKEKERTFATFRRYLANKYNNNNFSIEKLLQEELLVLDTRQSDLRLYRGKVPTLRTGRHGILYVKNGKFRKLSGFESLLLQGFPQDLALKVKDKVTDKDLLSQAGNAMTVNAISEVGRNLIYYINQNNL
jgi:DNA (cytosine-5)-methyltransferase 1